jgi:hydroxypyruvate isomerase
MRFSACVEPLFAGKSITESLPIAKSIGYDDFEFYCWWNYDLDEIIKVKNDLNMSVAGTCTKFITLTDISKQDKYIEGLKESIQAAKQMDCNMLISQTGNNMGSMPREFQRKNMIKTLRKCVPLLEEAGVTLAVEPLNTLVDHTGYFLYSSLEAFDIVEEVGSDNVKILFDIYHQQITEGNLISNIRGNIDKICHFHAAGNPGRNEIYYGEINYQQVFEAIRETGYQGLVGLEYTPIDAPEKGLEYVRDNYMSR